MTIAAEADGEVGNRQLGQVLGISEDTIKPHLKACFENSTSPGAPKPCAKIYVRFRPSTMNNIPYSKSARRV